jgi:hypothetical protein
MHASHTRRCDALAAAIAAGDVFSDDTPSAMFMDLDMLAATIHHMQHDAGYPGTFAASCLRQAAQRVAVALCTPQT